MPRKLELLRCSGRFLTVPAIVGFWLAPAWGQEQAAQQTSVAPDQSASQPAAGQPSVSSGGANRTDTGTSPANAKPKNENGTSKDRLFFTLPNFLTLENASEAPPLTAGEKFKVTARGSFDPVEFLWYGAQAGISQAKDTDSVYGQGMEGYAKRYGVRFADGTIENFFTRAIYPSILHQDPRYFQSGKGSFIHRAGYAVSRIFVTRSDSGNTQFNFSEIFGSATAAGISAFSYHERDSRNVDSAIDIWGSQLGWDALSYVIKEFWPDVRRKLHHSKTTPAAAASGQP
jgi:hypothetical protein